MLWTLGQVALGGAIGATARYLAALGVVRVMGGPSPFPVAILGVNVIGSFLMGVFVAAAAHRGLTHLSPFLAAGVLGGFTTFSTFSLEAMTLYQRGDLSGAALYVVLSVVLSLLGIAAGLWIGRALFA
jgi:CrcB protein